MSYCRWRHEVRFTEMELSCQRNGERAAGLFLSTQEESNPVPGHIFSSSTCAVLA